MDFVHTRPDHECAPTEHVVEKRKESLKNSVSALEKKLASGNEALQAISDAEKKLKSNAQKVKDSINNEKERVKDLVCQHLERNAKKKYLVVNMIYGENHKKITAQLNDIQSFVNKVNVSCHMAKNVLESGSNFEIIESDDMVTSRLGSLNNEEKTKIMKVNSQEIEYAKKPIDVEQLRLVLELGDVKLKDNENHSKYVCAFRLQG